MRKHEFRKLQNIKDSDRFDYNGFKKELYAEIDKLEDNLMGVELKLQESLLAATTDFTDRIKKIMEDMRGKTSAFIQEVNQEMEQFAVALKTYANQEFDRLMHLDEDAADEGSNIHDDLLEILGDPDTLNQNLETSKEAIEAKINEVESFIIKELNADWK